MSYRIHYSLNAESDVEEAIDHFENFDGNLCFRLLDDVNNTISSLKNHPAAFHYYNKSKFIRRANLSIFSYSLYFFIDTGQSIVIILAVIHNSRSKSFINKKLKSK